MQTRNMGSRLLGRAGLPLQTCAALALAGCASLGAALPALMDMADNLMDTTAKNYSPEYSKLIEKLMLALSTTAAAATASGHAKAGADAEALELQVGFWRQVADGASTRIEALDDGDVLYTGDKIKLSFRCSTSAHVYVVGIDGTGWATPMFPIAASGLRNPVRADVDHMVPDESWWFELDEYTGIEHVFVLASPEPKPELDEVFSRLEGQTRPSTEPTQHVEQRVVLERGFRVTKDTAEVTVSTESGQKQEFDLAAYFSSAGGVEVTRWFEHR